jgi:hypothetical protein
MTCTAALVHSFKSRIGKRYHAFSMMLMQALIHMKVTTEEAEFSLAIRILCITFSILETPSGPAKSCPSAPDTTATQHPDGSSDAP